MPFSNSNMLKFPFNIVPDVKVVLLHCLLPLEQASMQLGGVIPYFLRVWKGEQCPVTSVSSVHQEKQCFAEMIVYLCFSFAT